MPSILAPLHDPDLFENLAQGGRRLLVEMQEQCILPAHSVVLRRGDRPEQIFRVRTGWAARTRTLPDGRRQIISLLLPGDFFGVKGLVIREHLDSVEALTPVTLNTMPVQKARQLFRTDPDVAVRLLFQLADEDRRVRNWMVGLGRGTGEERLAAFVLELRSRLRRIGLANGNIMRLPLSQEQIGECLGMTVVHVNRLLRRLREAGVLVPSRRELMVLDAVRLMQRGGVLNDELEVGSDPVSNRAENLANAETVAPADAT